MFFFFQAEDGIRDLVRSRGLGDVYKRQTVGRLHVADHAHVAEAVDVRAVRVLVLAGFLEELSLIHI